MFDELNNERKRIYKESFEIYDTKKDGSILISDYENVLKLLNLNTEEFQNIINEHILKGKDSIKFEDFISDINSIKNEESQLILEDKNEDKEKLLTAFKGFEDEQERKISISDFKEILKSDEERNMTEEEIKFLISKFEKDGYIDYIEFTNALLSK